MTAASTPASRGRVAFVLSSLKFGGGERVVLNLASALQARGYAIDILLMSFEGEFHRLENIGLNQLPPLVPIYLGVGTDDRLLRRAARLGDGWIPLADPVEPLARLRGFVEEEGKGHNLLPTNFLRQLIGFYGGSMQGLVPRYLEQAMSAFAQQQEQVRQTVQKTMGTLFPFGNMEEVSRQNIAMMERAFSLFTPFYRANEQPGAPPESAAQEIEALRNEVDRLRRELEAAKGGKG